MLGAMLRASSGSSGGSVDIPTDYIAYWSMDNVSGSTLIDETGNYDGTIFGATQVTGIIGNALSFDGVNDYVDLPSTINLESGDFTASLWYYPRSINTQYAIFSDFYSNTADAGVLLRATASGEILFAALGKTPNCVTGQVLLLNQWQNITVRRSSGVVSIYHNNSKVAEVLQPDGGASSESLRLGRYGNRSIPDFMNADIDLFRIYKRALSVSEISALYNEVI